MIKSDPDDFSELGQANAVEAADWLLAHSPVHYDAVLAAVKRGRTPEEVYRYMLRDTFRPEIAQRCKLVARYFLAQ